MKSELLIRALAWQDDLLLTYRRFAGLPGFVLLQSGAGRQGRYDILTAFPWKQLQAAVGEDQWVAELESLIAAQQSNSQDVDLPFIGGVIGYLSYDYGAAMHGLATRQSPALDSLAAVHFGLYDWAIIVDHQQKQARMVGAMRQSDTAGILEEMAGLWQSSSQDEAASFHVGEFTPLLEEAAYRGAFAAVQQALYDGRCYQVNLTQAFAAPFQGNAWAAFEQVSRVNPVPFSAYLDLQTAQILSFSPERFMLLEGESMLASPIKGTIRRSPDPLEDERLRQQLAACPKNQAENVMIVDLMRNDLGRIAQPGSVEVRALCQPQSYNAVHHLVSDIYAKRRSDISPLQALLACFPGGSITGAPKLEAMRLIQELEPYGRGLYCGSVLYYSYHGRLDSSIAIRSLTLSQNRLHMAAGGALVIDSDWEEEYRECYVKLQAIMRALA